jgi:hypothetical protein
MRSNRWIGGKREAVIRQASVQSTLASAILRPGSTGSIDVGAYGSEIGHVTGGHALKWGLAPEEGIRPLDPAICEIRLRVHNLKAFPDAGNGAAIADADRNPIGYAAEIGRLLRDFQPGGLLAFHEHGIDCAVAIVPAELAACFRAQIISVVVRRLHGEYFGSEYLQLRDQIVRRDADDATVSQFQVASDGAVTIDSTHLSLEEVIDVICRLAKEAEAAPRDRES